MSSSKNALACFLNPTLSVPFSFAIRGESKEVCEMGTLVSCIVFLSLFI